MRRGERGFGFVELILASSIAALIGGAAAVAVFQTVRSAGGSEGHLNAVASLQSAGYWIGRDAQMADSIRVDGLDYPDFIILTWADSDYEDDGGTTTYHLVTYSFANLDGGVGDLVRNHWSTAGDNEDTLVARYIYFDPGDAVATSQATYQDTILTVRLRAIFGDLQETREYSFDQRTNLMQ